MTPTSRDYLTQIASDVERIAGLLEAAPDDRTASPVPACPEWDVHAVVKHLGGVHRMVTNAVRTGQPSHSSRFWPDGDEPLIPWFAAGAQGLLAALDTDTSTPAWSFDPTGGTVGWWQRRQTMETLVHRIDVEQALDSPSPIDPAIADDGVAEVLDTMVRLRVNAGELQLPDDTIELRATDTGDSWLLGIGDVRGVAEGTAEALLTSLWKRSEPTAGLCLTGDAAAVAAMLGQSLTP